MVIVYILLFIVCLSILIVVHELGHLTAAKIFKVYCFEFSVGFGPKILRHKRKNGETYFAWRAIPFGGYVSMSGEGEAPEGIIVDPKRSLTSIKKWKRAIIMAAGVTMNMLLAIVIFFISETACQQFVLFSKQMTVKENGLAENSGVENQDVLYSYESKDIREKVFKSNYTYIVDGNVKLTFLDSKSESASYDSYSLVFDVSSVSSFKDISYDSFMVICPNGKTSEFDFDHPILGKSIKYSELISAEFKITTCQKDEKGKLVVIDEKYVPEVHDMIKLEFENGKKKEPLGLSMYLYGYYNDFPSAVKKTFQDFGNSATVIFKSLGALFTDPNAIKSLSGPVGIGVYTTSVLQDLGWGKFLYLWGMISVNLAIVNLLPFPGLDGWHLLVLAVEGIAHREIPSKVKNTIAGIGLALLFAIMILIIIKDFIAL